MVQQPPKGHGILIVEASRSHSDIPQSVGLLWTSDQSDAERDLYLTTHNTIKRQISMPPVGFEPTIPASERPQSRPLGPALSLCLCVSIYIYIHTHKSQLSAHLYILISEANNGIGKV